MLKVIVFGSLNMDLSMECEGIPMLGDSLRGTGFLSTSGGKGGNEAVAAARMGAETYMVGKVGNDHNGRKLTSDLTIHGVSVSNVSVTARAATGVSLVLRSGKDRAVVTDPGANEKISYSEVRAAIHGLGQHRNVLLMSLGPGLPVVLESLACAKRNGLYTILRASVNAGETLPDEAYKDLDLLVVNRTDCRALSGIWPVDDEAAEKALQFFYGKGVRNCIITLKDRGSVTLADGKFFKVEGYDVQIVDASCAGDSYVGEIAAHIADGGTIVSSMKLASAAAAIAITRLGAQSSIPSWYEVQDFVKAHEAKA